METRHPRTHRRTSRHGALSPVARANVAVCVGLAFVSGAAWFALDRWGQVQGEFGLEPHPFRAPMLALHGAAALWAVATFGHLLGSHIPAGIRRRRNLISGGLLASLFLLLVASGWGLYYLDEGARGVAVVIHLLSGLLLPVGLVAHAILGGRLRSDKDENS